MFGVIETAEVGHSRRELHRGDDVLRGRGTVVDQFQRIQTIGVLIFHFGPAENGFELRCVDADGFFGLGAEAQVASRETVNLQVAEVLRGQFDFELSFLAARMSPMRWLCGVGEFGDSVNTTFGAGPSPGLSTRTL